MRRPHADPARSLRFVLPAGFALCLLSSVVAAPCSPALAAPAPSASSSAPAAPPQAPAARPTSALASTIASLAEALSPQVRAPLVFCGTLRADVPAPRAAELSARFASLLAGALGNGARAGRSPSTLDAARSAASGASSFVLVELEIGAGELRATADLRLVPRNIWDRARDPSPEPSAHAFASARLDAEVRSYLAPVPLVAWRAEKFALDESEIVALGCEDVDRDGSLEVLTVSRRNVTLGRVRQGKLQPLQRASWSDLSPIAPSPWREALGFVSFAPAGAVDIGVTDRARPLRLSPELRPLATLEGMPLPSSSEALCARMQPGTFFDRIVRCAPSDPFPALQPPAASFDVWASGRVVGTDGSSRDIFAAREPSDGRLQLRDSTGRSATLQRVGAQIAIADLDLDGEPEIVSARDVLDPREDALGVRTWSAAGPIRDRMAVPVPGGVSAVAICPPDGPGLRATLIATRSELWVLR